MGILRLLGIEKNTRYDEETGHVVRELPPLDATAFGVEFLALPKRDIPTLVAKYFAAMETGTTENWCRCPWVIHPDDKAVKAGTCRACGELPKAEVHTGLPEDMEHGFIHKFVGRRMRRMDDAPTCPIHSREGMLMYFFEWAFDQHD